MIPIINNPSLDYFNDLKLLFYFEIFQIFFLEFFTVYYEWNNYNSPSIILSIVYPSASAL